MILKISRAFLKYLVGNLFLFAASFISDNFHEAFIILLVVNGGIWLVFSFVDILINHDCLKNVKGAN